MGNPRLIKENVMATKKKIAKKSTRKQLAKASSTLSKKKRTSKPKIPQLKKVPVSGFAEICRMKLCKKRQKDPDLIHVQSYLMRFGYLKKKAAKEGALDKSTSDALLHYQKCQGLKETGEFNAATRKLMSQSRCGIPDVIVSMSVSSSVAASTVCAWDLLSLTFAFDDGTTDVAGTAEFAAVRRAFDTWANAVCLTFTEVAMNANPDIVIDWRPANDPDHNMQGGVLAHADFPPSCGVVTNGGLPKPVHFDNTEHVWADGSQVGAFDVETVALHEIGHILGLAHSSVAGSVMFASVSSNSTKRVLTADDLAGIRSLYPMICRRGDSASQAGFISEEVSIRHRTRQVVNAVRTKSGKLKLIAWRVNANGSVTRTGDSAKKAGKASHIDIARGSTRFVTSCRTGSGKLKLISWSVNLSGSTINRIGDSGNQAGKATMIKIVALSSTRFVTACRTSSGKLKLITWRLNNNGSITRLQDSDAAAGAVSEISMIRIPKPGFGSRVVTSVRTRSGKLKLIVWDITSAGTVTRRGDSGNQAGKATMIESVRASTGHVVVACRTASGKLKLISWSVSATGLQVNRRADSGGLAGAIKDNALMARTGGVVSAVSTGSRRLKLISWTMAANGSITRFGDSKGQAGKASRITLCQEPLSGGSPIVTSCRTASNKLKLITWDD